MKSMTKALIGSAVIPAALAVAGYVDAKRIAYRQWGTKNLVLANNATQRIKRLQRAGCEAKVIEDAIGEELMFIYIAQREELPLKGVNLDK